MPTPANILILAGRKSHGGDGNGIHDYPAEARALAAHLASSDVASLVTCRIFDDGDWPEPAQLAAAAALVILSDGRDGDGLPFPEATHLATAERKAAVAALLARGGGLAVIHFAIFAGQADAAWVAAHQGGHFQWQDEHGQRTWASAITTLEAPIAPLAPGHPVLHGVRPFRLCEEFYHDLTLAADAIPLLAVSGLPVRRECGEVVAWALHGAGGGRTFGTGLGHALANWQVPDYRRVLLNGVVWAAGLTVPAAGVSAPWLDRAAVDAVLGIDPAAPIRVLLLAGNEAHRWHNWAETTPLIAAALARDPRMRVTISHDPESLGRPEDADVVLLNYCNWQDPAGISVPARERFAAWLAAGGGVVVQHFANGAFHRSLPGAANSDWPEYRRIVPRVWDHHDGRSAHDPFARFTVRFGGRDHPATAGLPAFTTEDELYHHQHGEAPIAPLCSARSTQSGQDEPLAWASRYGRGRVFQNLLGHDARAYAPWPVREMLRGSVAWCAGRPVVRIPSSCDC